jgi:hypothetical protein
MAINYFTANPDVAEAYRDYANDYTPQEFADLHYSLYGEADQRAAPVVLDLISQGNLNPTQIAAATGIPVGEVIAQAATLAPFQGSTKVGDTYVSPNYEYNQQGEETIVGGLQSIGTSKVSSEIGSPTQLFSPSGELLQTGTYTKGPSFFGGLLDALSDPVVLAALAGGYGAGLFGGVGALGGATGLTASQLTALDMALGGAGGSTGAGLLSNALATGAAIPTITSLTGGSGVGTLGVTGANGAFLGEGFVSGVPAFDTALATAPSAFELANAGAGAFTPTTLTPVNTTPIITPTPIVPPVVTTPPVVPPVVTPPVVPPVVTSPTVTPPIIPPALTEVIKTIAPIAVPAIIASTVSPKTTTPTGFDIVPIPTDWKTPNKPTVAPYTPLTPIDFGTQNLLKGTQFEEFLNANYGKVPEPVKYSQPSNLSYNDLMSILGSRQGMPSASSLSINDIISGIQNQYGQAPTRTMG